MDRCKVCDRVPATEEQYNNTPEGEGEHLCWGEWSQQQCQNEAVDWHERYQQLLQNFKAIDKYNEVLYRCFWMARKTKEEGYNGESILQLLKAVSAVEQWEKEYYDLRKRQKHGSLEEHEGGRHMA
jgi:hypothetical protein